MTASSNKDYGFKKTAIMWTAQLVGPMLIRLVGFLCRYRVEGVQYLYRWSGDVGQIWAVWHGRMFLPAYHFRGRGFVSLVSRSWDGEVITRVVKRLGYVIRRGSPREGGKEGFNEMLNDLYQGKIVSIFPDGPKGPVHKIHNGVIDLARLSGAKILPISWSARSVWRFKSWDRFMLPKPFTRGVLVVGEPLDIPRHLSPEKIEEFRELLRDRLESLDSKADRMVRKH